MITVKQLQHLKAIMQYGTLHSAAESLHLTQSALTRSLHGLEEGLGVSLFNRVKRGMIPTAFCLRIAETCQGVLLNIEDIQREANLYRNLQTGELHVAFGRAVKEPLTRAIIPSFHAQCNQISLTVSEGTPNELIERLKLRQIDFILAGLGSYQEQEGISFEAIKQIPLEVLTRADHPLQGQNNLSFHQLLEYPSIMPTMVNPSNPLLTAIQAANPDRSLTPKIICSDYATLAEILLQSDSWLLAPQLCFHSELQVGKLSKLDIAHEAMFIDLHVLELNGRSRTPAGEAFIDICRSYLDSLDSNSFA